MVQSIHGRRANVKSEERAQHLQEVEILCDEGLAHFGFIATHEPAIVAIKNLFHGNYAVELPVANVSFARGAIIPLVSAPIQTSRRLWGHSPAGLFGYSHILGGYAGCQAEYRRVPFADIGPVKVPAELSDEQVLFLSDIFATGYMAADFCNIQGGETIAVWGCGPVVQMAIRSAFMLGAERVVAIDTVPERLALAAQSGTVTIASAALHPIYKSSGAGPARRDSCSDRGASCPDPRGGWWRPSSVSRRRGAKL
jgi:hypothetical protein